MKKDRWCGEFKLGRCKVPVTEGKPSLASEEIEEVGVKNNITKLSDRNSILNFLYFYDPDVVNSGEIPKTIIINLNEGVFQKYYRCMASNCRNKQKPCSHYK